MMAHRPVVGSYRSVPYGAYLVGPSQDDAVEVTLVLRRPASGGVEADPQDMVDVQLFAAAHGLAVVASHPAARSVRVSGPVDRMNQAFQVTLGEYALDGYTYRGREGDVHLPEEIADTVVAVLGLDDRQQAWRPASQPRAQAGIYPNAVAQRYGFPTTADGAGQTIAVIELGGGYRTSDLTSYFSKLGLKTPSIVSVPVAGAQNQPGDDADAEVALDIEVIGAVAQGAAQAVYFAHNTDAGFYQAISAAVHDQVRKPSVISISWGGPESTWTTQALSAFDALFADAAAAGITVLAAAGDNGSSDGTNSTEVDFPASSPHVVACGGTTLTANDETVWNELSAGEGATGGGVSKFFALPSYQAGVNVPLNPIGHPGRGVPDVAGNADPLTGYAVLVGGRWGAIGGTSAVAPLWAGLIAISNEINSNRAGAPHVKLYANPEAFNDIVTGNNGQYRAQVGWDACCGLGSPKGSQVVAALADAPPPPPDNGGDDGGDDGDGGIDGDGGDTGTGDGDTGGNPAPGGPDSTPVLLALLRAEKDALTTRLEAIDTAITALEALEG